MDHSTAETLLDDWLWGRLPPERASEVETHVAGCAECAAHAELMRGLKREVKEHGEALFSAHLTGDELARLELRADSLSIADAARLGAHVRACPTCSAERAMIRGAAGPAPWRALKAWYSIADQPSAWIKPALAMFAILLAWPAYLGVVEYPREKLAAEQARAEAARELAHTPPTPGAEVPPGKQIWNGGSAAVLVLTGATRGASAAVPSARLRDGQPGLTIVTDRHITGPDTLLVTLFDDQHRPVWKQPVPATELWDANARLTSLMIPSPNLTPGVYSIEIGAPGGAAPGSTAAPPQFQARFRIAP